MRSTTLVVLSFIAITIVGYGAFEFFRPPQEILLGRDQSMTESSGKKPQKSVEEQIQEAKEKSQNAKGLYMTAAVANDQGRPATHLRNEIMRLLDVTEANAVVIDVKETNGSEISPYLKPFIDELKSRGVWTIARIATFRDGSQASLHPDYYLKRHDGKIWRDDKGNAWMDAMSPGVRQYTLDFSKEVIDQGFDELQYDYIRFPSDGNLRDIVYPAYDAKHMENDAALADFLLFLDTNVRKMKPDVILSADIFGYVAVEGREFTVGQKLTDMAKHFDYISPMVYPSHYYSGLILDADPRRNLAAIDFSYRGNDTSKLVSTQPYEVVLRSLDRAEDILSGLAPAVGERVATTTASSTPEEIRQAYKAKFRPWLQDFDLGVDTSRGIYYDAKAVRAEIDAAEKSGASGWLLWSPNNIYTEAALNKK